MSALNVPESLKSIAGYVKLAVDTETRDVAISYWIRVYVMQKALRIDSKSPEARAFLMSIMDRLENEKDTLKDNEAVSTEIVGQAHVENYGQKIFDSADKEDRSGTASLKTVRAFLASAQVFEILSVFGEQTDEVIEKQKYAKYRASVIMKALKSGDKPPLPENLDGQVQAAGRLDDLDPLNSPGIGFSGSDAPTSDGMSANFSGYLPQPPLPTMPACYQQPPPPAAPPVCSHETPVSVSGGGGGGRGSTSLSKSCSNVYFS